jgi:hypothetical protein
MGTWDTGIDGNDTFNDIYHSFFNLYNLGRKPASISKQIDEDYSEMFRDHDDRNNALFGLAMAQWETKSLEPEIFEQVKQIIETGNDLELWKALDADAETLKKRKIVLEEFLIQLSKEKQKPKRRVKVKYEFTQVNIIKIIAPDNNKIFTADEHYENGKYIQTGSMMSWDSRGGGSVFYFTGQGMHVTAKWIGSQTLEITHDKNIVFTIKLEKFYFMGDQGIVIYVAI